MKLKSIWGLLIAIIEIEISGTLFCSRLQKKETRKKGKVFTKKGKTAHQCSLILNFPKSEHPEVVSSVTLPLFCTVPFFRLRGRKGTVPLSAVGYNA